MQIIILFDESLHFNSYNITALSDADFKVIYIRDFADLCDLKQRPDLLLYFPGSNDAYFDKLIKLFVEAFVFPVKDRATAITLNKLHERCPELRMLAPKRLIRHIVKSFEKPSRVVSIPDPRFVKGRDALTVQLFSEVDLIAPTNYHVMLSGETGTGKEIMARMIHEASLRSDMPFVALDCGCLNKETAQSELYGHVKGAFTDAVKDKTGAFEQANGGTLFLDEIGNLPYDVQVALLRSVQEKKIRKIGTSIELELDLRIITATHEPIAALVASGSFRQDLYYRLNEMSLQLPPLRARKGDIPDLVRAFLKEACNDLQIPVKAIQTDALGALLAYSWPGNIRELKNTIKRTCLMVRDKDCIALEDLPCEIQQQDNNETILMDSFGEPCLKETIQQTEYEQIMTALKKARYNKRQAASLLNIHRKTLYNKLKQMNIAIA